MTHKLEGESLLTRSFLGELDRCQAGPHSGRPLHEAILRFVLTNGRCWTRTSDPHDVNVVLYRLS